MYHTLTVAETPLIFVDVKRSPVPFHKADIMHESNRKPRMKREETRTLHCEALRVRLVMSSEHINPPKTIVGNMRTPPFSPSLHRTQLQANIDRPSVSPAMISTLKGRDQPTLYSHMHNIMEGAKYFMLLGNVE